MKYHQPITKDVLPGRTPHGVRGLKFDLLLGLLRRHWSHPARGAWIEMLPDIKYRVLVLVAPRTGCVD